MRFASSASDVNQSIAGTSPSFPASDSPNVLDVSDEQIANGFASGEIG
jgi:hypothetical protein